MCPKHLSGLRSIQGPFPEAKFHFPSYRLSIDIRAISTIRHRIPRSFIEAHCKF